MKLLGIVILLMVGVLTPPALFAEDGDLTADASTLRRNDASFANWNRPACCCRRDQRCGWTFSAGALYMIRGETDDSPVLFSSQDDSEILNGQDFDLGAAPGFELAATRHRLFGCVDLEARVFRAGEWSDDISHGNHDDPYLATDPNFVVPLVSDVFSEYESELGSFELNARWRQPCLQRVRWLAGLRCIRLDEEMQLRFQGSSTTHSYDVDTDNLMCGIQAGADVDLISTGRFCLRAFLKGGILLNQAEHESTFRFAGSPLWEVDESEDATSYMLETGVAAVWCINRCVALRAEYRFLWLDGLALAPDQTSATTGPPQGLPDRGIDTNGSVLVHGFYLGIDFTL